MCVMYITHYPAHDIMCNVCNVPQPRPGGASLNITSLACGGTSPASHFSCIVTARLREGDPPASSGERSGDNRNAEKGPAPSEAERTQAACVAGEG